jgi:SAM-dependent methyltransferase
MLKTTDTSWGKVAGWYDELLKSEGTFQKEVILPNVLRRMSLTKTDHVLDLACGQGFFSRAFVDAGATVIGADISHELIALAQRNIASETKTRLEFIEAPADHVPSIPDQSVDHTTVILAIQNIENVRGVFAECSRVLKATGRVHLVLNHPAFRIPKASDWGWDEERKIQYRREDRYLSESRISIQMHPGDKPDETTLSFHRPLQFYFKMLAKAGFCVCGLEEWVSHKTSDSGPRAKAENRARTEFPLFLYLEACPRT